MKKRLLSAFLALAMVLTLLPVSAFAATEVTYKEGNLKEYVNPNNANDTGTGKTVKLSESYDYTKGLKPGEWYWEGPKVDNEITIYRAKEGFINGTANQGAWYPTVAAYLKDKPGVLPASITLLSAITVTAADSEWFPVNFTVDLNGVSGFTLPVLSAAGNKGDAPMTTLKIQNRSNTPVNISEITTDRRNYETKTAPGGLNLTVNNVTVGSISLAGRANTVTLEDRATVTGGVTMDGESVTAYNSDGSVKTTAYAIQTLNVNANANAGAVNITNSDGAKVTVTDGTTAAINVTGNGGSVNVDGYATTGMITVSSRTKSGTAAVPTVTVGGGTVAGITRAGDDDSTALCSFTIKRSKNNININGPITADRGNVTVDTATTGNITVGTGSLTISGSGNAIQAVTLAGRGPTDLTINATTSSIASINATVGSDLTIKAWPSGRGNYYGTLTLGNYAGNGVKGGTFASGMTGTLGTAANINWFDSANLQFIVPVKNDPTRVALYGKTELTQAISDIAATQAADPANPIIVLGQGQGTLTTLQLNFGGNPWAYIKYNTTTGLILPTRINNTPITKWIVDNGNSAANPSGITTGTEFDPSKEEAISAVGGTLILTSTDASPSAVVSKITNVTPSSSTVVDNRDVTVRLNGNTIMLSGAITAGAGGYAEIKVDLTTDVVDSNGVPLIMQNVIINYNVATKQASFSGIGTSLDAYGAIVQNGELVLNRGTGAHYTVSANLTVSASSLELYAPNGGSAIVATIGGKISNWTSAAKDRLIEQLQGGSFRFQSTGVGGVGDNRAMMEAINAAQATITSNNSVATMIANTRQNVWKDGYTAPDGTVVYNKHTGKYTDYVGVAGAGGTEAGNITNDFSTAYIVPYLVVNVTDYQESGYMTATLTPYYRVDVSAAPGVTVNGVTGYNSNRFYTIQAGKPLSALTGDMSNPIKVRFAIAGTANFDTAYMHQDGKYVYQAAAQEWSIYHAGANGLGTIEINQTDGPIRFMPGLQTNIDPRMRVPALPIYKYDSLQAAIDDTVAGVSQANNGYVVGVDTEIIGGQVGETFDTIEVAGNYSGNCTITMTGAARKVRVVALGDLPIKAANQNVDVQNPSGYTYYIQLKREVTTEQPKTEEVTIAVTSAMNGTVSLSASKAKAGDSITITARPATGYGISALTVRTNTGANVTYQSTATNVYRFTVPENVTGITVTPTFAASSVTAAITIANAANGVATSNAADGKARGGSTVTITTVPLNGYSTSGVTAVTEAGSAVAVTRIAENTYTFVVPINATRVVVTPVFAAANKHPFTDVPDGQWYSDAVSFGYRHGIFNGYNGSANTFAGTEKLTRAELVTILYRLSGEPNATGNSGFNDVQSNAWYAKAVTWASRNGIVNGGDGNKFYPTNNITREQLAQILYKYNSYRGGNRGLNGNLSTYIDQSSISGYAQSAMQWAVGNSIIQGSSNRLMPQGTASRYEAATMLMRYGKDFMGLT